MKLIHQIRAKINHLQKTSAQYDQVTQACRKIFQLKVKDYGTSWRILRLPSLTDQLFIKAQRIRNIEDGVITKIDEGILPEFQGLVNYSIIGLINIELGLDGKQELPLEQALKLYDKYLKNTKNLMLAKNNDYGEAWRDMRISSYTDLILMKINRIKQIEDNSGKTIISEGIASHYEDIINYSVFGLIKLSEQNEVN